MDIHHRNDGYFSKGAFIKKQTRVLWVIMTVALVLGFMGCGSSPSSDSAQSDEVQALIYKAQDYFSKNDYIGGIFYLSEAIKLDPNNATAYGERASAYIKRSDYDRSAYNRAIADCNEALRINPNHDLAKYNLSLIQQSLRKKRRGKRKKNSDAQQTRPRRKDWLICIGKQETIWVI